VQKLLPDNPHVLFAEGGSRGYVRVDLERGLWRADLRAMASVADPAASCGTLASYVVEAGRAGPVRA
jgi:alkaline phosphatase D